MQEIVYSFAGFTLDPARRELRSGEALQALQPQVFDLLLHVVRNRHRVVSRDELIETVWEGRIVSESTIATRINAARVAIGDSGEAQRLLRTLPRQGVRFVGDVHEFAIAEKSVPPRLSILVLPFANIGAAPEQEYFADGVTESLTTDLSRMRGMMVIGRSTAFTYKGKRVDLKQVGRELGVRYVLEGSVQRSGDQVRVNAQLIDVETGKQVWAERFDKNLTGLFDMQDEIVARLANQLGTQMITAEARRAERSPAPDSLDLFFQGMACISRGMTPEYLTQASGYFKRALSLDPGNIEALVYRAYVDTLKVSSYAVDDRAAPIAAAEAALSKALSIVPDHAYAHGFLGYAQIQSKRPIQGIAHCERALELDRNLASAHAVIGLGKSHIGRGEETEAHVLEAMRLSPRDMFASNWLWIAGVAKLYLRQSAEAVVLLQQSIELNRNTPITHIMLASALAHLGRLNEAQLAIKAGLGIAPHFNMRRWSAGPYSDHPSYMDQRAWVAEGLRIAGLPE